MTTPHPTIDFRDDMPQEVAVFVTGTLGDPGCRVWLNVRDYGADCLQVALNAVGLQGVIEVAA